MAAERDVPGSVPEKDTCIGAARDRLAEDRKHDAVVPARFEHQRGTEPLVSTDKPPRLVDHRAAARDGEASRDEPNDSPGGMRVGGGEADGSRPGHRVCALLRAGRTIGDRSCLHARRCVAQARTEHLNPVKAFYSDHFVLPLPPEHSFPMAKYRLLRERLGTDAILPPADLVEAPAADWETLRLVHTRGYADAVRTGTLPRDAQRRIGFPWSPEMVERSRRSVGATIAAARHALSHPSATAANLAGGTHHAFTDRGEGFCVFNDVAVATRLLTGEGVVQRVAVIDCDVHQGNGTAAIFRDDPAVFTFSTHGRNNYPFRKEASDLDLEWPDGTGDGEYLAALEEHVAGVLARHRPDLVFYLAGADPYEGDRWGRLKLTIEGLRRRDAIVFDACGAGGVPVAVTMAGGYARDVDAIVTIHANTIRMAVASAVSRAATRPVR